MLCLSPAPGRQLPPPLKAQKLTALPVPPFVVLAKRSKTELFGVRNECPSSSWRSFSGVRGEKAEEFEHLPFILLRPCCARVESKRRSQMPPPPAVPLRGDNHVCASRGAGAGGVQVQVLSGQGTRRCPVRCISTGQGLDGVCANALAHACIHTHTHTCLVREHRFLPPRPHRVCLPLRAGKSWR